MPKELSLRINYDDQNRVVSLPNLRAMCNRVSGCYCHQFEVSKITDTSVTVAYSNEDEYAHEHPMYARFPAFVDTIFGERTLYIVIGHLLSVTHDNWDGEGWQAFQPLMDCPKLFKTSSDKEEWKTREEIENGRR